MVDRRRFVTAAAATLVAAGLPAVGAPQVSAGRWNVLTAKWWQDRLNAQAELQGRNWHLVQIVNVHAAASSSLEQFAIVFRASPGDSVSEGIYRVKVGNHLIWLFVQPALSDASGSYCVAAVSRLL